MKFLTSSEMFFVDDTPEYDYDIEVGQYTSLERADYEVVVVSHLDGSRMPFRMRQKSMEYTVDKLKVEWEVLQDRPTPLTWDDLASDPVEAVRIAVELLKEQYERSMQQVFLSARQWGKTAGLRPHGVWIDEATASEQERPLAEAANRLSDIANSFKPILLEMEEEKEIKRCPTHGLVLTQGGICRPCVTRTSSTGGSSTVTTHGNVTSRRLKKPEPKN